jgi:hypothetical protein
MIICVSFYEFQPLPWPLSFVRGGGPDGTRETRVGWPLQSVETEVNGDSKRKNDRGPSLVGSLDSLCWDIRFWSLLYFPHCTLFHFISPHRPATWAGMHAGSPIAVSLDRTVRLLTSA